MNFLAHAYLAALHPSTDDGLVAGGVAGDWVKGALAQAGLPPDLERGVALHRAIDAYADRHPAFLASRARCVPEHRRWSGVFADMFYDHLLARDWAAWHPSPLSDFCERTYAALARRIDGLPGDARPALQLMASERWLESYRTREGLADVLARMGRRVRRTNPLADGLRDLDGDLAGFEADCRAFLVDASDFVRGWRG